MWWGLGKSEKSDKFFQSIYNAAVASHPELAGEIAGVSTAFKGTTVAGTVADNQKAAADLRNKNIDAAQAQGYLITPGMY